jgi:hypothetical protein
MTNIIQTINQCKELVTIDLEWFARTAVWRKDVGLHSANSGKKNNHSFILSLSSAAVSDQIPRRGLEKSITSTEQGENDPEPG